jgi:hypothetical protein
MNDEIPYNPPGMDEYHREGARKNSELLRKHALLKSVAAVRPLGAENANLGRGAGRPLTDSVAATGHIHLRVVMARKNWYVRMARLHNLTLAKWMQRACDEESGYPPKSQLVTANR